MADKNLQAGGKNYLIPALAGVCLVASVVPVRAAFGLSVNFAPSSYLGSVDPIATRPMRLSRYEVLRKDGAWTPGDGLPAAGVILRATTPVAEPAAAPPSR